MASIFVEQGAAMKTKMWNFEIPPASMSNFDILSMAVVIFFYRRVLDPIVIRIKKSGAKDLTETKDSKGLIELQRMGIGFVIAVMAMLSAETVEN